MGRGLGFLITMDGRVSRRAYALTGLGGMALKYAVEAFAIRYVVGTSWSPLDYLSPLYSLKQSKLHAAPSWFLLALAFWTLPFVWIGASMTLRRARDAGLGGWPVLCFFVPILNYAVMLYLVVRPSRPPKAAAPEDCATREGWAMSEDSAANAVDPEPGAALQAALMAVGVTALGGLALTAFCTLVAGTYGTTLFLGLPFVIGFEAAYVYNRQGDRGAKNTFGVVTLAVLLTGMLLLLFAVEGLVCVAMVFPIALPVALFGAAIGRALAANRAERAGLQLSALLILPLALFEATHTSPAEFEVLSTIEVAAPPERVWPNVIGFAELPPPEHWLFSTGIAYPVRARIEGQGVGAVRRCEFSTGAFVEPVTAWEPPARLAFDVRESPVPMEEWSFYAHVRPPHLERSFRSVRGEFRLVALPGGHTRLEGRTWYRLELFPVAYWRLISDQIVKRIHQRVLSHVKALSETGPAGSKGD